MSDKPAKMAFGSVNDEDKDLKGKARGGSFGLNVGNLTVIAYNPNAGKDNTPGDAVDITLQLGESEFRNRVYETGDVFDGDNKLEQDFDNDRYVELYNADMKQRMAVVIHTVKAVGVTQEQIDKALSQPLETFADWAKVITSLVPNGFESKPVDAFLEYQWSIKEGQNKTFLQLPQNMKGGRFLAPHVEPVGSWKAISDDDGLRYIDDANNEHPFTRTKDYMESNKANQQFEGQENTEANANISGASKPATSTKW